MVADEQSDCSHMDVSCSEDRHTRAIHVVADEQSDCSHMDVLPMPDEGSER